MDDEHIALTKPVGKIDSWTFKSERKKSTLKRWERVIELLSEAVKLAKEQI